MHSCLTACRKVGRDLPSVRPLIPPNHPRVIRAVGAPQRFQLFLGFVQAPFKRRRGSRAPIAHPIRMGRRLYSRLPQDPVSGFVPERRGGHAYSPVKAGRPPMTDQPKRIVPVPEAVAAILVI